MFDELVTRFGRHCYCQLYNSCLKCPPFAHIHARKRLRHSSVALSMTLWFMSCQTSTKRFVDQFVNAVQLRLMHSLLDVTSYPVIDGLMSVLFGGHRLGGMKAGVDCSRIWQSYHYQLVVQFFGTQYRRFFHKVAYPYTLVKRARYLNLLYTRWQRRDLLLVSTVSVAVAML